MSPARRHPGPASAYRHLSVPSRARRLHLTLPAGLPLIDAIGTALAGQGEGSAFLEIHGARAAALGFVGPDWPDPEGRRIAWYSETRRMTPPAEIIDLRLFTGLREGKLSLHGHGLWRDKAGVARFGHILPDESVLEAPVEARGWALPDARFKAAPCTESEFSLFHPQPLAACAAPEAALVKLAPSAELGEEICAAVRALGFARARVAGIGSLLEAHFADGRVLESNATEFLITDGEVSNRRCDLDIEITGVEGQRMAGRLAPGQNRILVSAELLILREDG